MKLYRKIACIFCNYYRDKIKSRPEGYIYFSISLITFFLSLILSALLIIIRVYYDFKVDTKLCGTIIFLTTAVVNYRLFIGGGKLNETKRLCQQLDTKQKSRHKIFVRTSYFFVFLLFLFSMIVEATNGYLYMVAVYLRRWGL